MKPNPILLIIAMLSLAIAVNAQTDPHYRIVLNNGIITPVAATDSTTINNFNKRSFKSQPKVFAIMQFEILPDASQKAELKKAGIELLDYLPVNAYTVTISKKLDASQLKRARVRAVIEPTPAQKMHSALAKGQYPAHSLKNQNSIDLWISVPRSYTIDDATLLLRSANFTIIPTDYETYRILSLEIPIARLNELASLPCVEYVQPAPAEDQILNNKSNVNTRANVLQSLLPGERALKGKGVVIGVGDDSNPIPHIDFNNRLINRNPAPGGFHGMHVMGTVGSAGIVDERFAGLAPGSTILAQYFSNVLAFAPTYVQDYGMVITNNSYGNVVNDCSSFGVYDLYSRVLDQQAIDLPSLQHVFAAGNSGTYACGVYPGTYGNVLGSYQSAKNVICVGNGTELNQISASSSRGPVSDGRIKPEIVAQGTSIWSTGPGYGYYRNSGTSMSSPAVSGGLGLLYERYRQLHGNNSPKNGLMKALLLNGATDFGNPGPDYVFGFGWMNLLRSVKMLENNNYYTNTVNAGAQVTHSFTIPAGSPVAKLKVMLYWNDPAGALLANPALVNDLDLTVTDPSSTVQYPLLLDTTRANVGNNAIAGADHVNNIEQVVIDNPSPGTYLFKVNGTTIPSLTSQEYHLVFDTIPVSTKLSYPIGGERFAPLDTFYINWEFYGNPASTFTLEYYTGSSWSAIGTSAAGTRQMIWQVPAGVNDQARIRITQSGTGVQDVSEPFTIVGVPAVTLSTTQCEGYSSLEWSAITGATDYEIMMLRGEEMQAVAVTTSTNYSIPGLSKDSMYWMAVRARVNGNAGRRSIALSRIPDNGSCSGAISDNDLKVDALISPVSGREFTSTALAANSIISVRVKNLDDAAISSFDVKYSVNGGAFVSESISATINALGTYTHNFSTPYNFSAIGNYIVRLVVKNTSATDPVTGNDTLTVLVQHVPNAPIVLTTTTDHLDDFEAVADSTYRNGQIGISGNPHYDFTSSSSYGRLRTFVNSGIAAGNKGLTLDVDRYYAPGAADSLKATFNLASYSATVNDIRLDFLYKHHGELPNAANKAWVRASDTQPWIEVYDLYANQVERGDFVHTPSLEISDLLVANGQTFSSSTQFRFGQWGQFITADNLAEAGYTFDNIRLSLVTDDIQMLSLDAPVAISCGLSSNEQIKVSVRNSDNSSINNIPVKYQVDNGTIISELIPSINGNTTIQYSFNTNANIIGIGAHTIKVWVDLGTDSYRANDTSIVTIYNAPYITSFPYLQNFELGDGGFHAEGELSSWQYGTPASVKINKAASGIKAWKTNLSANYNDREESYLYSPCFNVTGMTSPTLSFSLALDLEDCGSSLCDEAYVEYSVDGKIWTKLGAAGQGTNWYNRNYSGDHVWSIQDYTRWHVATIPLPVGIAQLRLRFVVKTDPYLSKEGMGIDDIHIYDNTSGIYSGPPATSAVVNNTNVNGSNWIDFKSGGKLIASIQPNGQTLGATDVQTYINTGSVRFANGQYYHDRNITIKPANNSLADSVGVRFYFLDSETESLINATTCGACVKPASAYELGVSKYSDADDSKENGSLADDNSGDWKYIIPANVMKVPFDKGYYAEFKVKDFSEFWLNNGGVQQNQALPLNLLSFDVVKNDNDVILSWHTANENNTAGFEIQLATSNELFQSNSFRKIGYVKAAALSGYEFTDNETNKTGTRYYRLKLLDNDGRFTYSNVRPVVFNNSVRWQVFPNPSSGVFNIVYQGADRSMVDIKVYDLNGKLTKQVNGVANGFIQKQLIDLASAGYASGLYMLDVTIDGKKETFRLIRK